MNPFEDLIHELSYFVETTLHPDAHQSCLISFPKDDLTVQIDLDSNADRILLGSQLGRITPGVYRERIFLQAMRINGTARSPIGALAFSEKNDSLVLFQFLDISRLNGEKLYHFLQIFREHAKLWKDALKAAEIPAFQEETPAKGSGMFGLKP